LMAAGEHAVPPPARVMFLYWGRRGAMVRFTHQLGQAAIAIPSVIPTISISRQNEAFAAYGDLGSALYPVETFSNNIGALTKAWRLPALRAQLGEYISAQRITAVVNLMPHVWTPFVIPTIRRAGARYVTIAHDASAHPGDGTSLVKPMFDRDLRNADTVITLSQSVADQLLADGTVSAQKLVNLFHPDMTHTNRDQSFRQRPAHSSPFRLLFLGRIMAYKGLPLLLDALDILRADGHDIQLGVFGEGELGASAARLAAIGAEVANRWLSDAEIDGVLNRYHVVVASHIEASQSGVVATAFGYGLPVVATPAGGLGTQVSDGTTGLVAEHIDAQSLATALRRVITDANLYRHMCRAIDDTRDSRSMDRFVRACVAHAVGSAKG
jgi:glycosyltransferase involved in cell wall biosynthesis